MTDCNRAAEVAYTLISCDLSSQDLQPGGYTAILVELVSLRKSILRAGWTTEQLREYIASGRMQPSLRLLGITGQPKPATAMGRAAEASWKAFQNACKHPDSVPVSSLSQCASFEGLAKE